MFSILVNNPSYKALHWKVIPLGSIVADELDR